MSREEEILPQYLQWILENNSFPHWPEKKKNQRKEMDEKSNQKNIYIK